MRATESAKLENARNFSRLFNESKYPLKSRLASIAATRPLREPAGVAPPPMIASQEGQMQKTEGTKH
jgi:hypothetical protein